MDAADNLDISKMIAEAVRAAVAVNSNALDVMLADDAALDNKNGFSGGGAGLDDSTPSAGGAVGLWQFAAGEWSKCLIQIGYNITDVAASLPAPDGAGTYRIVVDLTNDTVTLESGGSQSPDFSNNIVYFRIATFAESNGELIQTWSVGAMPVAYKYV